MRTHPFLLLAVGLTLAGCDNSGGPSQFGTLSVSTFTEGDDPDPDGYLLTVDGVDSLALAPNGAVEVDLPPGRHTLRLLGVATPCLVAPAASLEVEVPSLDTTSVAFEINCLLTGARITTTTTGLDVDPNGYRVEVDATDRGILPSNGTVLTRLDPGSRTITLAGLAPNCTMDGPDSRSVTIVDTEVEPIEFAVVCTATSGVIGVVVEASGADAQGGYLARVDGASPFRVGPGAPTYRTRVPPGDHVLTMVPPTNCSVETGPQSLTITAGGLIRDTVEVTFLVSCRSRSEATLRLTAPTTGRIPARDYSAWICDAREYYCRYGGFGSWRLGVLAPNGILVAEPAAGNYVVWLRDVPARCSVLNDNSRLADIQAGRTLDVVFAVACSP